MKDSWLIQLFCSSVRGVRVVEWVLMKEERRESGKLWGMGDWKERVGKEGMRRSGWEGDRSRDELLTLLCISKKQSEK